MRFIKNYNLKFPAISAFAKTKHCANCVREFGQQFSGEEGKGLVVVLCLHVMIVRFFFLIGVFTSGLNTALFFACFSEEA